MEREGEEREHTSLDRVTHHCSYCFEDGVSQRLMREREERTLCQLHMDIVVPEASNISAYCLKPFSLKP